MTYPPSPAPHQDTVGGSFVELRADGKLQMSLYTPGLDLETRIMDLGCALSNGKGSCKVGFSIYVCRIPIYTLTGLSMNKACSWT